MIIKMRIAIITRRNMRRKKMKQQKKKATMTNKLEKVINTTKIYLCLSLLIMKEVFMKQIFLILELQETL